MRKLAWGLAVLAALAAVVFVLERSAAKPLPDQPSKVEVRAARGDRSVVKATGIIKPRVGAEVRVGSRVSGVVKRLYVPREVPDPMQTPARRAWPLSPST